MAAEMKGPPSLPCWRWTGSLVRSTSAPVTTTCCTGASSRPTSMNSGLRRSRRRISGKSFCGGTPKACANPRAARQRIADERVAAGGVEQHRFRIGFERVRDLGELGDAGPALQLLCVEPVDERPQPIAFEIDRGGCDRCRDLRRAWRPHHAFAFFTSPTLASSGSSVTWNTIASVSASSACACQHGTVITSPTARFSSAPPSILTRALPLMTE